MTEPALPAPQPIEARPEFTVGSVLSRSFSVWGANVVTFFGVSLLLHAPLFVIPQPMPTAVLLIFARAAVQLLLSVVVQGTLIYAVFQQLRGQPVPLGRALASGLRNLGPVLWTAVVSGFTIGLWSLLLFVPGMMAACRYWVAIPAAVMERASATTAMDRSAKLTDGHRWPIFGLIMLLIILSYVLAIPLTVVLHRGSTAQVVGEVVITALIGSLSAVVYAVGYYYLRAVKEGIDLEDLVKVFA